MKINRFIFFLSVGVILLGVIVSVFFFGGEMKAVSGLNDQNLAQTTEGYSSASISERTILLLLAVGVIGAIGVSRQKKVSGSDRNRNSADQAGQDDMTQGS